MNRFSVLLLTNILCFRLDYLDFFLFFLHMDNLAIDAASLSRTSRAGDGTPHPSLRSLRQPLESSEKPSDTVANRLSSALCTSNQVDKKEIG